MRRLASAKGITPRQLLGAWAVQSGHSILIGSSSKAHIIDNLRIFSTTLMPRELSALTALATLAESSPHRLRPSYAEDVYCLFAPPGGLITTCTPSPTSAQLLSTPELPSTSHAVPEVDGKCPHGAIVMGGQNAVRPNESPVGAHRNVSTVLCSPSL